MRPTRFVVCAAVSFALSLIALGGINNTSIPELNSFASAVNFPVGSAPEAVAVGDFNGDGRSDLAVANRFSNNVSILISCPGAVTFARPIQVFSMDGGAGGVNVSVAGGCAWQAVSDSSWIEITSSNHGIGNGSLKMSG